MSEERRRRRKDSEPESEAGTNWTPILIVGGAMLALTCCGVPAVILGVAALGQASIAGKAKGPAEVVATATAMCNDYKANESAANAKYKGKVVEVRGRVRTVRDGHVELDGEQGFLGLFDLRVKPADPGRLADFRPGQEVRAKGVCGGHWNSHISIEHAVFLD